MDGKLYEAVKLLRKEKMELAIDLLFKLGELKKAREDISLLHETVGKGIEINSLQSQLDEERKEKLELCGRVWGWR